MKRKNLITLLLLSFIIPSFSQVSNIKEKIENDKKESTPYNSTSKTTKSSNRNSFQEESLGESLAEEIFIGLVRGVSFITYHAQKSALYHKEDIPNLISAEIYSDIGSTFEETSFDAGIRGNWGILSSEFNYNILNDNTGTLKTINWQALIIRVPLKNIKFNYGIGFTTIQEPRNTYFESSIGLDFNSNNNKWNFNSIYKWTARKKEERFRQIAKCSIDYSAYRRGFFNLAPYVGFEYQNYFMDDWFMFGKVGMKIRFN